jgi:CHASE2 domain-containing sensor protein
LRLALLYLKNSPLKLTSDGLWIDKVFFPQLQYNTGGYQLPAKEALGYQILINYRSSSPQQISLREILNGSADERLTQLIKDRIVFIGVAGEKQDMHDTPYSNSDRQTPGVMIHAHMVSQILSATLNGRSLLWWWPQWVEILWIGSWSLLGSMVILPWKSLLYQGVAMSIALVILVGSCYILLLAGGWIPFVPSALGLIATGAIAIALRRFPIKQ